MKHRLLFAAFMMVAAITSTAFAQTNYDFSAAATTGQTLYYRILDGSTVAIVGPNSDNMSSWDGYTKPTGALTISSTVQYNSTIYTVTSIANCAFYDCEDLTGSLVIPNVVTSIGDYAFYFCEELDSLTIGGSVTSIGGHAFDDCDGLTGSLVIPNSVTSIGESAFQNCTGLNGTLTIGNSVTSIGAYAFVGCSFMGSLVIPNSVTSIGNGAFQSCNFDGTLTIPNSVTSIGNHAFIYCSGFTGALNIPNSVTAIGSMTFYGCNGFTGTLAIPNSVTSIGASSFWGCSGFSGSLNIPNSVTSIGNGAFAGCSGFTGTLTIPNTITSIGDSVFKSCSGFTGSLTIPNSVTSIGSDAFWGCSGFTGSLTIPNSVTFIGNGAFSGCSGLTGILTIPNAVTSIGNMAFLYCGGFTGTLIIPNSVLFIGERAFEGCAGFTGTLAVPNSVTTISNGAFWNCSGFTSVTIPNSVTSIVGAFGGCSGLISLTSLAVVPPAIVSNAFYDVPDTIPVYVPCGSESAYQADAGWSYFSNIQCASGASFVCDTTISLVCTTGQTLNYYLNCDTTATLTGYTGTCTGSLTIPDSVQFNGITYPVTSIGKYAFYFCTELTGTLIIPNTITVIDTGAFLSCLGFTGSLSIPNSVTYIGKQAFYDCGGFTGTLTIPNSVTFIGSYAFGWCSGITGTLTIPNSVISIGTNPFEGCNGLTSLVVQNGNSVYDSRNNCNAIIETASNMLVSGCQNTIIPNTITSIGEESFYCCSGLTGTLTIPSSVTSIGHYAFLDCSGITTLIIPNSVTFIDYWAFKGCIGITSVTSLATVPPSLGANVFLNVPDTIPVHVPCGSMSAYQADAGWSYFSNIQCATGASFVCDTTINLVCTTGQTLNYYLNCDTTATLTGYTGTCTGSLTIPDTVVYNGMSYPVTAIGTSAFSGCSGLTGSLTIPNSITVIDTEAFWGCSGFTSLTIGNSVTNIGAGAFWGCSSFTGPLTIPNTVTTIGYGAFYNCSGLTSVTIPNSVVFIAEIAFCYCEGLTGTLTIPNSVTSIGTWAFTGCSGFTGTLTIPNSVISIGGNPFEGCSGLTSIVVQNGNSVYDSRNNCNAIIETASNMLVSGCQNTIIPSSITSIGREAFSGCSGLTGTLVIPNSVTSIDQSAFMSCSGLTSLIIPNSVISIGFRAFDFCSGITSVTSLATVPPTINGGEAFSSAIRTIPVYVPCGAQAAYRNANGWNWAFSNYQGLYDNDSTETVTACNSYEWHGTTYIASTDSATYTTTNVAGCDSTVTLNLTINQCSTTDITACDTFTWNGTTYAESGTYIHGTDTLNLTVNYSTAYTVTDTACNSYRWHNTTYTTSTTTATYTTTNAAGCDSVVTLHLTVNHDSSTTVNASASSTYTWHNTVYTSSGTYTYNYITVHGCNGEERLHLTILTPDTLPSNVPTSGLIAYYPFDNSPYDASGNGNHGLLQGDNVVPTPAADRNGNANSCYQFGGVDNPNWIKVANSNSLHLDTALSVSYWMSECELRGMEGWGRPATTDFGLTIVAKGGDGIATPVGFMVMRGYNSNNGFEASFSNRSQAYNDNFGHVVPMTNYQLCDWVHCVVVKDGRRTQIWQNGELVLDTVDTQIANFSGANNQDMFIAICGIGRGIGGGRNYWYPNNGKLDDIGLWNRALTPDEIQSLYGTQLPPPVVNFTVRAASANSTMGSATVVGNSSVQQGAQGTVQAIANSGYRFVRWSDGSTANPYTFTVTQDTLLTAYFEGNSYTVTVVNGNPGRGMVSGSGTATYGSRRNISAAPNYGYTFSNWSDGDSNAHRTITVTADITLTAYFGVRQFHIGVAPANYAQGTVTGSGDYDYMSTVTIEATPANGYEFAQWSDGDTLNPRRITVMRDSAFTATFREVPVIPTYTVTATSANTAMGSVTGGGSYEEGTVATLTARANDGYEFVQWNDGVTANPRSVTVLSDTVFTATFREVYVQHSYTVSVLSNDGSIGRVTGGGIYSEGAVVHIAAYPLSHCRFVRWSDGVTEQYRTFTAERDISLIAFFARDSVNITARANDDRMGRVTGGGSYAYGSTATLTATPLSGYRFVRWSTGERTSSITVTVRNATSYTAFFDRATQGVDEAEGAAVCVWSHGLTIHVAGLTGEPLKVYDVTGRLVAERTVAHGDMVIPVTHPGLYLVQTGTTTHKVLTR